MDYDVGELFEAFADEVFAFLCYFVRDEELAKDLTQDTFIRAMRGARSFLGNSNPRTWLIAIARNLAIDYARKSRREVPLEDAELSRFISNCESPENSAERSDLRDRLLDALYRIKPEYRDVILCREIMDLSSEETGRVLGWTANRVRVTLHRAIKAARKRLSEGGLSYDFAE